MNNYSVDILIINVIISKVLSLTAVYDIQERKWMS